MSTDPHGRIRDWKRDEGHIYGEIIATDLTYDEAQERERLEAQLFGCYWRPGGERVKGRVWSVYYVSGGTVPE